MPNENKKYPTYDALSEAFKSGELDREKYVLVVDNDNCRLRRTNLGGPDGDYTDADEALDVAAADLFEGYGYADLAEAISAAGIPTEGA